MGKNKKNSKKQADFKRRVATGKSVISQKQEAAKKDDLAPKLPKRPFLDVEEMKQYKVKAAVYIVIRVIIVAILILSIFTGHYQNTFTCILTLVLLMIPSFFEHRLKIEIPNVLEIIVILFVFSANILGEMGDFYQKFSFWDTMLHTLNGFICAGVGFGMIDILNRSERVKMNLSPLFVCLFSFCFSMTVGVVWEFFEFAMDMLFAKDMQKDTIVNYINSTLLAGTDGSVTRIEDINSTFVNGTRLGITGYLDIGIIDTMKDLIVNFIGAVVFNVAGFFLLIGRNKGGKDFIRHFVPTKIRHTKKKKAE